MLDFLPYNVTESVCRLLSFAELKAIADADVGGFFPTIAHETQVRCHFHNFLHIAIPDDPSEDVWMVVYRGYGTIFEAVDLREFSPLDFAASNSLVIGPIAPAPTPRPCSESTSRTEILEFVAQFARIPDVRLQVASTANANAFLGELLAAIRANLLSPSLLILSATSPPALLLELAQQSFRTPSLRNLRAKVDSEAFQKSLFEFIANGEWENVQIDSKLPFSFFEAIVSFWSSRNSLRRFARTPRSLKLGCVFSDTIKPDRDYEIVHPLEEDFVMNVCVNYVDNFDLRLTTILLDFVVPSVKTLDHSFFLKRDQELLSSSKYALKGRSLASCSS